MLSEGRALLTATSVCLTLCTAFCTLYGHKQAAMGPAEARIQTAWAQTSECGKLLCFLICQIRVTCHTAEV